MNRAPMFLLCLAGACGGESALEFEPFLAPYCTEMLDEGPDGVFDVLYTPIYVDGLPVRRETDSRGDGTVDAVELFQHDARGNMTRWEWDGNLDGTSDIVHVWEFDENDNETRYVNDRNGDGASDFVRLSFYTANGVLERREVDAQGDGVFEAEVQYTADDRGNPVREDVYVDGELTTVYLSTFEESRLITRDSYEADGTSGDYQEAHTYDERHRIVEILYTVRNSTQLQLFQWDDRDRLVEWSTNDSRYVRTYDCPGI